MDEKDFAANGYLMMNAEAYLVLADINSSYWYAGDADWVGRRRDSSNTITYGHSGNQGDSFTFGTSGNTTRKTTLVAWDANASQWDVWEGTIC